MIKSRGLFLLYCLSAFLVLVLPVYSNPMQPTMTEVFIAQNGIPVDSVVDFSLDCYGVNKYHKDLDLEKYGVKKILNVTGDDDTVYAYAGSCRPDENCVVYKPDLPWVIQISHCDLSGTYKGQPFLLKNFSREPLLSSGRMVMKLGNQKEPYAVFYDDYRQCTLQQSAGELGCKIFLTKNISTGISETTPEYRQCRNEYEAKKSACIINNATRLNTMDVRDAIEYNELRFEIPSDNKTTGTAIGLDVYTISPIIRRSPVESLYCSILSIFNISC